MGKSNCNREYNTKDHWNFEGTYSQYNSGYYN